GVSEDVTNASCRRGGNKQQQRPKTAYENPENQFDCRFGGGHRAGRQPASARSGKERRSETRRWRPRWRRLREAADGQIERGTQAYRRAEAKGRGLVEGPSRKDAWAPRCHD